MEIEPKLREAACRVRLLIMDCDGVLTDGKLYFSENGESLKVFHARDGQGIAAWHNAGLRTGIVSGRSSKIVNMRAEHLGVEFVFQGRKDKVPAFLEMIGLAGVSPDEVAYIGDDSPDVEVMRLVGLPAAVADAVGEVRSAASFVTTCNGGQGAVREFIDMMLAAKSHGKDQAVK